MTFSLSVLQQGHSPAIRFPRGSGAKESPNTKWRVPLAAPVSGKEAQLLGRASIKHAALTTVVNAPSASGSARREIRPADMTSSAGVFLGSPDAKPCARRRLIHLRFAHLSGRNGLLVLLEVLRESRS